MTDSENVFEKVTVFMFASNETQALREAISIIRSTCNEEDIDKILVVLKDDKCPSFFEVQKIIEEYGDSVVQYFVQTLLWTECLPSLPEKVNGTHFIYMASDMEMNPHDVSRFIERAKKHPERIICAAKWLKGSTVEGYTWLHEFGSRAINTFVRILYGKDVREPFSFYQIYPKKVYDRMPFSPDGRIFYEYTLWALRMGEEYEEIPTVYKSRNDGKSNLNYLFFAKLALEFCLTAIRIRFTSKGIKNENESK